MHPIAFHIGSFAVHWYGVFIGIGFLIAFGLLMKIRKYADLSVDQVYNISMIALFAGVIGARLFYVIQFWNDQFAGQGILNMLNVHNGGLVFYGGFILAFTAECIYAKWQSIRRILGLKEQKTDDGAEPRKNISLLALLDILGPAMALAHAFGRISCFMQGCCFGKPAPESFPLAVQFPKESLPAAHYPTLITGSSGSVPLFPVQLFESAGNLLMCAILLLLLRKRKHTGMIGGIYLILYGVMRFLIEFMRGDHSDYIFKDYIHFNFSFIGLSQDGFTPSQFIALAVAIPAGIVICCAAHRLGKKKDGETEKEAADA